MTILPYRTALIVGAMASLGAALARALAIEGLKGRWRAMSRFACVPGLSGSELVPMTRWPWFADR